MRLTTREVAEQVGGRLVGRDDLVLAGMVPAGEGGPDRLTFATDERTAAKVRQSGAGAALVREGLDVSPAVAIVVPKPKAAARSIATAFRPPAAHRPSRHATAVVAPDATVPASCAIGPYAVIEAGAALGERVRVGAHAVIGAGCRVGDDTVIHPHAVLYERVRVGASCVVHAGAVLGRPGFGYEPTPDGPSLFPQIGDVVIGDRVDVGALTAIDAATFSSTRIEDGAKIDNLCQVAHNVTVGRHAMLCAQTGISGSSVIGERAILGGQVGIANRVEIRPGTIVGAQGGIGDDTKIGGEGEVVAGCLAQPIDEWILGQVLVKRMVKAERERRAARGKPSS
jgi:UDP-3-O-[3-hydroxymyristoyl] glucosamine N-acyltransferase